MRTLSFICAVSVCAGQQTPAEKLIAAGHWKQARALVERRIAESPSDPLAYFLLSQVRNAFGERTTPLPLAEKAVALDGSVAKYHRQLAEVLGVVAQRSSAFQQLIVARRFRREIDMALSLEPRDLQALRDLIEYNLLAPGLLGGDSRKAAEIAARIAAIDPAEGFLSKARIAAFRKRTGEAEALTRRAVEAQPSSYRARIALAELLLAREDPAQDAAEAEAREAWKIDGGRVEAPAILASIYAARGNWNALEDTLGAASRLIPDDPVPYYRAAERLLIAHPRRAERYLRIYLSQEPEGNQPTAADARVKLTLSSRSIHGATVAGVTGDK